jgi:hypothetical protein
MSFLSARENLILSKDQEISSLRHQLDASSAQFKEACHGREIAIADNRRLQRDPLYVLGEFNSSSLQGLLLN